MKYRLVILLLGSWLLQCQPPPTATHRSAPIDTLADKVTDNTTTRQPDYRLHDLWVLDSLDGTSARALSFSPELPSLEINTREASFIGFAGCNQMRGQLITEGDRLQFTDIITTRMMCPSSQEEAQVLAALRSVTAFSIGNNRLRLSDPNGVRLVFKKID